MRVLLALGGNAMTSADGRARVEDQIAAGQVAMAAVAGLLERDVDVVITHGNGPQVGNLLVKNELAAAVVPPVPLDWCGAQTQATLGLVLMNALEAALAERGIERRTATVVTRTRVASDDAGFTHPTKPIGRYLPADEPPCSSTTARPGRTAASAAGAGSSRRPNRWRSSTPLPSRPSWTRASSSSPTGVAGSPSCVRTTARCAASRPSSTRTSAAALLARTVGADVLVVATDVPNAILRYGTPNAEAIGTVTVSQLRGYALDGHFASGSMGPKVDAACRFVEQGGTRAVITSLDQIADAVAGKAGTVVVPD